ncbi:MAG: hypothetical protein U0V87_13760 [Acidobacteriota bacterium]
MVRSAGTSWASPPLACGVPALRGRGGGRSKQEDDAHAAAISLDSINLSVRAVHRYKCFPARASLRSPHLHGVIASTTGCDVGRDVGRDIGRDVGNNTGRCVNNTISNHTCANSGSNPDAFILITFATRTAARRARMVMAVAANPSNLHRAVIRQHVGSVRA